MKGTEMADKRKLVAKLVLDLDIEEYAKTYGIAEESVIYDAQGYMQGFIAEWMKDRLSSVANGITVAEVSVK